MRFVRSRRIQQAEGFRVFYNKSKDPHIIKQTVMLSLPIFGLCGQSWVITTSQSRSSVLARFLR